MSEKYSMKIFLDCGAIGICDFTSKGGAIKYARKICKEGYECTENDDTLIFPPHRIVKIKISKRSE